VRFYYTEATELGEENTERFFVFEQKIRRGMKRGVSCRGTPHWNSLLACSFYLLFNGLDPL
jgi:hypothetical protein